AEDTETLPDIVGDLAGAGPVAPITIQFDTPTASAVANTEQAVRGIPGVRSATTTSLALGGLSLLRVTFAGDPEALRAALEARGYQVLGSGQTLRIRRAARLLPPDLPVDGAPPG
ncbi:MAG TPA: heavy-metal-associated domain-containing protein, partial [Sphingomonas sp.]|nr:heavy-metal-associated domain-containing protein [Sphingomonas sp.]